MVLTIRQMRYFVALAELRHFGRAAAVVHVSQPALSAQIADMEQSLGRPLVGRGRGAPRLTGEGEALLPDIRDILDRIDRLPARGRRGVLEGRLRLGLIPTVAPYLVPELLPRLRLDHPSLSLELKELMTGILIDEVKSGRLDCAVIAMPVEDGGLGHRFLFEDRFMIASGDEEETVLLSPVTADRVDYERLLLLEEGHCLRDQALAVCGVGAGRRVANFGATSMATLLQMVSHGMGITLIPEIAVKDEAGRNRMRIVPFAEPQPSRRLALVWRRSDAAGTADREALSAAIIAAAGRLLLERQPA